MQVIQDRHWVWYVDDDLIPALLAVEPGNPELERRAACCPAFVEAVRCHREGRLNDAIRVLEEGAAERRHAGECYAGAGQIYFEQQRYEEAARVFEAAAAAVPPHPAARFNQAVCLEKMRRYRDAALAFEKAAQLESNGTATILGLAHCLLCMRSLEPALATFERCLEIDHRHFQARFGRAAALQLLERYDEALDVYGELLMERPADEDVLANLISMSITRGDLEAARRHSEKLRALKPDHRAALEGLAAAALAAQDYPSAAKYCVKLTEVEPELMEAWFNLGIASQKLGRLEWAAKALKRASELRPDQAVIHTCLGAVLQLKGDWEGAAAAFALALKVAPNHLEALWGLEQACEQTSASSKAEKVLEQILTVTADSPEAWFRLGWFRAQRQAWAPAAAAFERCSRLRDDWADAFLNLGIAQLKLGDEDAARASFQAAGGTGQPVAQAAEQSNFTNALVNLGHALRGLGKEKEARECWSMAAETLSSGQ